MQQPDHTNTFHYQSALATYCRTGQLTEIPGINQENVSHYRRLVYNVVNDMLENAYPLTVELLSEKEWEKTVGDFFSQHACQSPQVWYMPKEFYDYLIETQHPILTKYPVLKDLLWFEWIEVELFMMEDRVADFTQQGDRYKNKLVLNPEFALLSFSYPVFNKSPLQITAADKGNYYAIAHRDREGEVKFNELSPALVRMIEYLASDSLTLPQLLGRFESEYQLTLSMADQKMVAGFIDRAFEQQLLLGFIN